MPFFALQMKSIGNDTEKPMAQQLYHIEIGEVNQ
jgi:hypothetical protein